MNSNKDCVCEYKHSPSSYKTNLSEILSVGKHLNEKSVNDFSHFISER